MDFIGIKTERPKAVAEGRCRRPLPKNKLKVKTAKARVKKAKEKATAAVEKTERSMKIRVAALEKVLWGKSFEGKLADRRPKVIGLLKKELVHK